MSETEIVKWWLTGDESRKERREVVGNKTEGKHPAGAGLFSTIQLEKSRGGQRLKILIQINRTIKIFNAAINF